MEALPIRQLHQPSLSARPRRPHNTSSRVKRRTVARTVLDASAGQLADLNWVETALNDAILSEDYPRAAELRDVLQNIGGGDADTGVGPRDWFGCGLPKWLAARCVALGYRAPTEVQRRALPAALAGRDVAIRAGTGSGKTLALLLPLLANLDFAQRALPQALLVVPTRVLGVQHALLAARLLGLSPTQRVPGNTANTFSYAGPRGVRVAALLCADDVASAAAGGAANLRGASLVVGTPAALGRAIAAGLLPMVRVTAVAVDEADVCLPDVSVASSWVAHPPPAPLPWEPNFGPLPEASEPAQAIEAESMLNFWEEDTQERIPSDPLRTNEAASLWLAGQPSERRSVLLAGATLPDACLEAAAVLRLVDTTPLVRATVGTPWTTPAALTHRVVVSRDGQLLATLVRCVRRDRGVDGWDAGGGRAIVFAPSPQVAMAVAAQLRDALWGVATLAVLLPDGAAPERAAGSFAAPDGANLLLTTPCCGRGVDFPDVRHVYCMGSADLGREEYLHRAGRAARVGTTRPAAITTVVATRGEVLGLRQVVARLGITLEEVSDGDSPETDDARRLEDLLTLTPE